MLMRFAMLVILCMAIVACGDDATDLVSDDSTPRSGVSVTATSEPVSEATSTAPSNEASSSGEPPTEQNTVEASSTIAPTETPEPTPTTEPTPTAEPTAEPVAVVVTASGFGQEEGSRQLGWAFTIENPNAGLAFESSEYQIAFFDDAGTVIKSESGYITLILPNETVAYSGSTYLPENTSATSMDVTIREGDSEPFDAVAGFTSEHVTYLSDSYTPKVSGIIHNPYTRDLEDIRLSAVAYNEADEIIGGGFTFLNIIPAQSHAGATVSITSAAEPARVELFASLSNLTLFASDRSDEGDPLVLLKQGFGHPAEDRQVGWGFVVENPESEKALDGSTYHVVVYEESGIVIGEDSGYIYTLLPGQTLGLAGSMFIPEGRQAVRMEVHVLRGNLEDLALSEMFVTENVMYVADTYSPKATGVIKNLTDQTLEDIRVAAIAYNEAGEIIGGGFTYVDFVPGQGQAAAEVSIKSSSVPAMIELYPTITSLTELAQ